MGKQDDDKLRIEDALQLASDILDNHTDNTDEDRGYRNAARMFLMVLSGETDLALEG